VGTVTLLCKTRAQWIVVPFATATVLSVCALTAAAQSGSKARGAAPGRPQPAPAARGATPLYTLKPGQMLVYSVTVKLDGPKEVETLLGPAAYHVTSADDGITLQFQSALETRKRPKEGVSESEPIQGVRRWGLFRMAASDAENTLKIDSHGAILRQSGDSALPSFLGSLPQLLLETLPDPGETAWNASSDGNIVTGTGADRVSLAAREKVAGTLEQQPGAMLIKKQYDLATRETVGGEPRLKISGLGRTIFDSKAGAPKEMTFDGTVAEASKNTVNKTLVSVSCKLLDGENRQIALQQLGSGRNVAEEIEEPVRDPELIALIGQLKSGNKSQRKAAADKLASWPPNENRPQVARALTVALTDGDLFARWSAVTALGVWYTKETVPDLIKRLDDPEHAVRWETEKVLGQIKDPRACMPLALMVDNGTDRDFAANALEAMGPIAEEVAIKLLGSFAWEARNRAAKMLAHWGTKESVATLRLHLRDDNGIVSMAAKEALRNIGARTGQ
jgi:hypothetical protein